jgi:hypothetical protein
LTDFGLKEEEALKKRSSSSSRFRACEVPEEALV